ncbi:MAG: hypothetical protein Q9M16_10470, partial [Mariprofundus sp.]|nr:hypothetical protein [Mariprofundus sp.]
MLAGILSLISAGIGIGGEFLKGKQAITKAKAEKAAELIQSKTDNDHAWEMQQINAKDAWLRRGSFLVFSIPMIWAAFDAQAVSDYFTVALGSVPDWYVKAYMMMIGGIWGIAALKG